MTQSDKKIQIEHFQNIVAVAFADGLLDDSEKSFLAERAEDYGLLKETVDNILKNVDNLEFIIPLNAEEREEQLSDAVYMAMINGNVEEREYDLCLKIAEKLDLDRKYLDEVIDLTKRLWDND
jgi:tellurite resistance protein